jgi:predicted alpha-1,2-mannosidase
MMRGRYANGSWYEPFSADTREPYITEGTPRQYGFYVPHDVPGLARLMGGRDKLESALDELFAKGEYWHGNEPGHQIPFMYNYTAGPHKAQKVVREILLEEYSDGPGGLSGNDDAGQMSAWYVFAAMGFYPIDPVSGNYQLTTPLFDRVNIRLENGRQLEIVCYRKTAADQFIERVHWNGKSYNRNFLQHELISQGGKLEIWLREQPTQWGSSVESQTR